MVFSLPPHMFSLPSLVVLFRTATTTYEKGKHRKVKEKSRKKESFFSFCFPPLLTLVSSFRFLKRKGGKSNRKTFFAPKRAQIKGGEEEGEKSTTTVQMFHIFLSSFALKYSRISESTPTSHLSACQPS